MSRTVEISIGSVKFTAHPLNLGAVGVTGTAAANAIAEKADVILGFGTRFQDFTTGSWALFQNPDRRFISLNVQPFDAAKHRALGVVGDARASLAALDAKLGGYKAPAAHAEAGCHPSQRRAERVACDRVVCGQRLL